VRGYQVGLGWLLGGQCRFHPSCSFYALDALRTKPAWRAVGMIVWRILRCQPLCKGGDDPVEEAPSDHWYRL
jgi:putative membrane protein insertion efficiency factor